MATTGEGEASGGGVATTGGGDDGDGGGEASGGSVATTGEGEAGDGDDGAAEATPRKRRKRGGSKTGSQKGISGRTSGGASRGPV